MGCNKQSIDISAIKVNDPERYQLINEQFRHFLRMQYPDRDLSSYNLIEIDQGGEAVTATFSQPGHHNLSVSLMKKCGSCKGCH